MASLASAGWVALGGALGSLGRWGLTGFVQAQSHAGFPWGTFAVNAIGSLAIGMLGTLAVERMTLTGDARLFLVTGVLGGFTTFSAFSFETLALLRTGQWPAAVGYAGGSVVIGVIAAFAGMRVAQGL